VLQSIILNYTYMNTDLKIIENDTIVYFIKTFRAFKISYSLMKKISLNFYFNLLPCCGGNGAFGGRDGKPVI
jgi:hypothetical protein